MELISDTALEKMIKIVDDHHATTGKNRKDEMAVEIVRNYIIEHIDKPDPIPDFTVYIYSA